MYCGITRYESSRGIQATGTIEDLSLVKASLIMFFAFMLKAYIYIILKKILFVNLQLLKTGNVEYSVLIYDY